MGLGRIPQRVSPSLFAGRLRHKIDIVKLTSVQDSMGGSDQSCDVVFANVWASVEAMSWRGEVCGARIHIAGKPSNRDPLHWRGPELA